MNVGGRKMGRTKKRGIERRRKVEKRERKEKKGGGYLFTPMLQHPPFSP
jgi:hypothetical protein